MFFPSVRESLGFIEGDFSGFCTFREHVLFAVVLEDVGVGEVEPFLEDYAFVCPRTHIGACSVTDLSFVAFIVQHFEKKVMYALVGEHEGVGNKAGLDVGDLFRGQDWVFDALRWCKLERGGAAVDAYGPDVAVAADLTVPEFFLPTPDMDGYCNCCGCYGKNE